MKHSVVKLIIFALWSFSDTACFPCDKEFFKNLTVYACTYPKRGLNFDRTMLFTPEEINRRFEEIVGENSDFLFEDVLSNRTAIKRSHYNSTGGDIKKLQMLLLKTNPRLQRKRRFAQSGFTHLSQFTRQVEGWEDQEEHINKKHGRSLKVKAIEKLVWHCCFDENPCYITDFSRIC